MGKKILQVCRFEIVNVPLQFNAYKADMLFTFCLVALLLRSTSAKK